MSASQPPSGINYSSGQPDPEPAKPVELESTVSYNARLGLMLFGVYFVIYAVFVVLCTFALPTMGKEMLGMNVAVCYGFALILMAFLLAAVYLFLCKR